MPADEIGVAAARRFLAGHLGHDPGAVELVGAGHWSRCFGFVDGARELVVRFGTHLDDFERDRRAAQLAGPGLPVPAVLAVGPAFDGWFAISTRVRGVPLESLDEPGWRAVLPDLLVALDALQAVDLAATTGCGSWDADGNAPDATWRDHLLGVAADEPDHRIPGWRRALAQRPDADRSHRAGLAALAEVAGAFDATGEPRAVVHGDLLNANAFATDGRITGIFDWGCARSGDPLYELALLDFWSSWHPGLAAVGIRARVEEHWAATGRTFADHEARVRAGLLHVGVEHQGFCAVLGRDDDLRRITAQVDALVDPPSVR